MLYFASFFITAGIFIANVVSCVQVVQKDKINASFSTFLIAKRFMNESKDTAHVFSSRRRSWNNLQAASNLCEAWEVIFAVLTPILKTSQGVELFPENWREVTNHRKIVFKLFFGLSDYKLVMFILRIQAFNCLPMTA